MKFEIKDPYKLEINSLEEGLFVSQYLATRICDPHQINWQFLGLGKTGSDRQRFMQAADEGMKLGRAAGHYAASVLLQLKITFEVNAEIC